MSWLIIPYGEFNHVIPDDELSNHYPQNCPCHPEEDEIAMVHIHNSFDGREAFEEGLRKPS